MGCRLSKVESPSTEPHPLPTMLQSRMKIGTSNGCDGKPPQDLINIKLNNVQRKALFSSMKAKLQETKDNHNITKFEDGPDLFEKAAGLAWIESVPEVVERIRKYASTASVIRIRNVKYGKVYPTSKERCTHRSLIPYFVSAGLSHVLGSGVVGWQEDLLLTNPFFHDIRPVKGGQEGSNGGGEPLNFHQDMSYEFERAPEFLTLACLREGHDKNVRTPIVPNRQLYEMVQQYHPEDMKVLKDYNSYRVKLPPSMGGAYADPMPLLTGDSPESATFWLRVNYDRIESMTEEAAAAFKRLQKAMDQLENDEVHLVDGDLLLIGNKKCLHRRTDFTAQFDGDDRLLVRNYSKLLDHTIVPTHRFMDLAPAE